MKEHLRLRCTQPILFFSATMFEDGDAAGIAHGDFSQVPAKFGNALITMRHQ